MYYKLQLCSRKLSSMGQLIRKSFLMTRKFQEYTGYSFRSTRWSKEDSYRIYRFRWFCYCCWLGRIFYWLTFDVRGMKCICFHSSKHRHCQLHKICLARNILGHNCGIVQNWYRMKDSWLKLEYIYFIARNILVRISSTVLCHSTYSSHLRFVLWSLMFKRK